MTMVDMSIVCGILQLVGVANQLRNGEAPPCVDVRTFHCLHISSRKKKKTDGSSTKKPSLILTLTAFGYALIAIQFNSYLFPTNPKADLSNRLLLDHEFGMIMDDSANTYIYI